MPTLEGFDIRITVYFTKFRLMLHLVTFNTKSAIMNNELKKIVNFNLFVPVKCNFHSIKS